MWRNGWASDLPSEGHGFDSGSGSGYIMTLGKLFTPLLPLSPSSINSYRSTVVMLSGWEGKKRFGISDFMSQPPMGSRTALPYGVWRPLYVTRYVIYSAVITHTAKVYMQQIYLTNSHIKLINISLSYFHALQPTLNSRYGNCNLMTVIQLTRW